MLVQNKKISFLYILSEKYECIVNTRNDKAYVKDEQSTSIYIHNKFVIIPNQNTQLNH